MKPHPQPNYTKSSLTNCPDAARDLLNACKLLLGHVEDAMERRGEDIEYPTTLVGIHLASDIQTARAAITKAEGMAGLKPAFTSKIESIVATMADDYEERHGNGCSF